MNPQPTLDLIERGAIFSDCGTYRYSLRRTLDGSLAKVVAVLLNPSVANDARDDPTTSQNMNRFWRLGYGRYEAVNLFAIVGTDPEILYRAADPVGPENDRFIRAAVESADLVVVMWGTHGAHHGRAARVLELLRGHDLWCIGVNNDGSPRFPRAVPLSQPLMRYAA